MNNTTDTRYTLFISDLHLEEKRRDITEYFLNFLNQETGKADALYILGDFFEVWVGDDALSEFQETIALHLKNLAEKGVMLYFLPGNRDFLLGKKFLQKCHMTLLKEPAKISLYGHDILLLHGDALCIEDKKHQRFRRFALNPLAQKIFLSLPLGLRIKIGRQLREKSRDYQKNRPFIDVDQKTVQQLMQKNKVEVMVHGHTHIPGIHRLSRDHQRIVLGAWEPKPSFLRVNPQFDFCLRKG